MESLSDYMLLEVFDRLDPASLKNCTETCTQWNDLISKSASTMDKLTLDVNRSRRLRNMRDIHRRYSNMKFNEMTISPKALSLLSNSLQNLRKLELNRIKIPASDYMKMLQSIPTLEELTISKCCILKPRNGGEVVIVKMPMLQKLTISESSRFLQNIDGSALKKLELSEGVGNQECDRFASSLHALEDLSITSTFGYICGYFALAKVQLKKLKIRLNTGFEHNVGRVCSLVKTHAATLETLESKSRYNQCEVTEYDLTNVAPFNSLSTRSFEEFYNFLLDVSSPNYSNELFASTAKYYIPQLKTIKIYRPRPA